MEPAVAPEVPTRRRIPHGLEIALVVLVATAVLLPGIWRYSLVDPWEGHYGEVARRMLDDHDWVHTDWQNEGFRSKPVLTFWLMASSLRLLGHAEDGGYSGEMTSSPTIMLALRLPFVLLAIMGLTLLWVMLARLVSRRAAWLALLTVGTSPFFFMVARQGITDMTLVAMLLGAFSMFLLASEDGDDPIRPYGRLLRIGPRFTISWDLRWVAAAIVGGFVLVQAIYYLLYFQVWRWPTAFKRSPIGQPGWFLAVPMILGLVYVFVPRAYVYLRAACIWLVRTVLGKKPARGPDGELETPWQTAVRLGEPGLLSYPLGGILHAIDRRGWAHALATARRFTDVLPVARTGTVYMIWFWAFIGVSVLGKGIPGLGIAGVCCAAYVVFMNRWARLAGGTYELKRGIVLLLIVVLPWHIAMWLRDGQHFISEWIFTHNLNRAAAGVHGDRGTFNYCLSQVGQGMMVWGALVPMALAGAALVPAANRRAASVRFMIGAWAVVATALFSLSQTKFHHYIFPAVPALAILVALWLDDVLAGRIRPAWVVGAFGAAIMLLLARDMMFEEKQWIEMYVYRYDRPWPSQQPYGIDTSDGFLVIGLVGAAAVMLLATPWKRLGVFATGATALGTALWAMHVYMPIAGQHWGMRDAVARYYQVRQIYGQKLVYANPRQFADDWAPIIDGKRTSWDFDTVVPESFQDGQPMAVNIEIQGATGNDGRLLARGAARRVGHHTLRIDFRPGELGPIGGAVARYRTSRRVPCAPRARPGRVACAIRVVDADRLIAWQLYWRGENFWSGDEIWGPLPEMKTAMKETDNVAFLRYLKDPNLAPEGRKYYIVTEASRPGTLKTVLPTATARDTVEVLDTTSNKFSLAVFQL